MRGRLGIRLVTVELAAVALVAGAPAAARAAPHAIAPSPIRLIGAFEVDKRFVTVPHRSVTVVITLPASAAGSRIRFTASHGARVIRRLTLTDDASAVPWRLRVRVAAPAPGAVRIVVSPAAPASGTVHFRLRTSFVALAPAESPGSTGQFVALIQQRLAALHLYIRQTGVYDQGTELALDAYHRLLGEGEGHTQLDPVTVTDLLDGRGRFHVRFPDQGRHAEGDLSDQVLAFVEGSNVHWLFPISSGKPSTPTIVGNFQVYYKEPDYTADGMYFSAFFHGAYAIHGYDPAPDYPASHGCMRLPMLDAIPAYNWIQVGDDVDTYYT